MKWTMKNGKEIDISDMTDQHLINCIKMFHRVKVKLHRAAINNASCFVGLLRGEMALYYAEQEFDRLIDMSADEYLGEIPEYCALIEEASNRDIYIEEEK